MNADSLQTPIGRFKAKHDVAVCQSPCLKMPASPFLMTLGYGTGVSVYLLPRSPRQGKHRSPWAVKKINKANTSSDLYCKRLKEEAKILKSLSHKNVVGFRALTKAPDGMLCLALEDAEKSLISVIEDRMENSLGPLPAQNIITVASDIAEALLYLHNKMMLHGDVKSGNVLIKGDFAIAKLCDFGVTVKLDENLKAHSSLYVGTEAWSSKEALNEDGYVTDKSDVYSYGLVIYEMLSLDIPHFGNFPSEEDFETEAEFETAFAEVESTFRSFLGTRPLLPLADYGKAYEDVLVIFYTCTDEDPSKRPSAKQLVHSLLGIVQQKDIQCRLQFD